MECDLIPTRNTKRPTTALATSSSSRPLSVGSIASSAIYPITLFLDMTSLYRGRE